MSTYATFLSRTGLSSGQFLGYAAVGSLTTGLSLALAVQEYRKVQPAVDKSPLALRERNHVRNSLGYCTAGLAITTATAAALRGRVNIGLLGGLAISMLPMIGTQMVSYEEQPVVKHALWATTCTGMGAMLSPMAFLPTTVLQGAFLGTAMIAGPTVFVGLQSATNQFNWMGAGLMLGLGVVSAATFGRMFLPHSNMLAALATYGGVGLFSLFLLYDANNLKARARQARLDPINDSFNIYLDSINIFVRMAEIQSGRRR